MAKKSGESGAASCSCTCHPVKQWVCALSLIALGAVGLWWNNYFMTLLYWLLLLHGLLCAGRQMCKCC
ncbi:MAG: hypothetical protein AABX47_05055 [Nanoarchaeota archaeon]